MLSKESSATPRDGGRVRVNGFRSPRLLRQFNTGFDGQDGLDQRVYERDDGEGGTERVREFDFFATLSEIEIAPGVTFPAWTYNDQVPGPTLMTSEGLQRAPHRVLNITII